MGSMVNQKLRMAPASPGTQSRERFWSMSSQHARLNEFKALSLIYKWQMAPPPWSLDSNVELDSANKNLEANPPIGLAVVPTFLIQAEFLVDEQNPSKSVAALEALEARKLIEERASRVAFPMPFRFQWLDGSKIRFTTCGAPEWHEDLPAGVTVWIYEGQKRVAELSIPSDWDGENGSDWTPGGYRLSEAGIARLESLRIELIDSKSQPNLVPVAAPAPKVRVARKNGRPDRKSLGRSINTNHSPRLEKLVYDGRKVRATLNDRPLLTTRNDNKLKSIGEVPYRILKLIADAGANGLVAADIEKALGLSCGPSTIRRHLTSLQTVIRAAANRKGSDLAKDSQFRTKIFQVRQNFFKSLISGDLIELLNVASPAPPQPDQI